MSASTSTTRIRAIRTVGVPVTDQERSLAFYRDRLGFETRIDARFGEDDRWIEVAPAGGQTSIALVRTDQAQRATVDTAIRLVTDDVANAHAALAADGVDVDPEIIPFPVPMFVFRDPDGNALVIVQEAPAP